MLFHSSFSSLIFVEFNIIIFLTVDAPGGGWEAVITHLHYE